MQYLFERTINNWMTKLYYRIQEFMRNAVVEILPTKTKSFFKTNSLKPKLFKKYQVYSTILIN